MKLHIPTVVTAIGIAAVITGVYLGTAMTERRIINDCLERQEARVTVMRIACELWPGWAEHKMTAFIFNGRAWCGWVRFGVVRRAWVG